MANLTAAPAIVQQLLTDTGVIAAGYKLFSYAAGTTTKLATYTDVGGLVAQANPIVLDAAGRVPTGFFLLPASYKFVLAPPGDTDPPTAPIWSRDNIGATPGTTVDQDFAITAGEALTANDAIYISDGSGALTAGRAYKADADNTYSSTTPTVGFAVADVAVGASGTARGGGRMTGFIGLTAGATYYVSATAGGITTTAPVNARVVGQADSTSSLLIATNPPITASAIATVMEPRIKSIADLRLSLTTGLPVTVADVTAAGTLYAVPYNGNVIGLYTGTIWTAYTFGQLPITVPAVANQVYDVFLDYNDGTPQLVLLAWTNDTTRATALTLQDNIPVKTGDTQQRHIGTVRTVAASELNDSYALRHVWNRYNKVDRPMRVLEATNSWTYTTATWRQANAAAANQLDVVCGESEDEIAAQLQVGWEQTNASISISVAIGLDSTSAPAAGCLFNEQAEAVAGYKQTAVSSYRTIPAVGRHTLVWLEWSTAGTGTTTWYGDTSPGLTPMQSGLHGTWRS